MPLVQGLLLGLERPGGGSLKVLGQEPGGAGGRIGWLRWSSPTLAVEVRDATLGWRLRPLLQRTLQLGELSAASVQLTPLGPPSTEPPQPLAGLALPLRITLPALRIDELTWAAATPVVLRHIEASYRYDGRQHHATLARLELAQGRYSANATLAYTSGCCANSALPTRGNSLSTGMANWLRTVSACCA